MRRLLIFALAFCAGLFLPHALGLHNPFRAPLAATGGTAGGSSLTQRPGASIAVYFSPGGGCTAAIVAAINQSSRSIYVQAYSFTSAPIARALVSAARRGVVVYVILDKSQRTEHYSSATYLAHAGIPVWIDAAHRIAHNKIMILDASTVITGSFNFTRAAEYDNAENLLIIHSPQLAAIYARNWTLHRHHSTPY